MIITWWLITFDDQQAVGRRRHCSEIVTGVQKTPGQFSAHSGSHFDLLTNYKYWYFNSRIFNQVRNRRNGPTESDREGTDETGKREAREAAEGRHGRRRCRRNTVLYPFSTFLFSHLSLFHFYTLSLHHFSVHLSLHSLPYSLVPTLSSPPEH